MASSPNVAAALFLLLLIALFSTAAHGRESHFFSRVAANTNPTPTTVTVSPDSKTPAAANNVDPNAVTNGQQYQQQQQQPSFVQETENNGYGIYGHQAPEETASFDQTAATTKLTSSPTKNFRPYNQQTNSDETFRYGNANNNNNNNNNEKYYNNDRYYGESGYNGDNNNDEFADEEQEKFGYEKSVANSGREFGNRGYENSLVAKGYNYNNNNGKQQGQFGETSLQQQGDNTGYETAAAAANSGREFRNGGFENSAVAKGYNYDNENNGDGVERQGMSDTRYLEGGKYYVEAKNPNQYQGMSGSRNDFNYNNNVKNDQNGYYSNGINGDHGGSYEYYANRMNNRNQNQQPEYFQGNNYQNQQYVP
ncbi:unnamed protein product [Linum trigynum]|uniref:Protein E6 n=1 Tax=Linum trigynum TaxID=586398 RepID=A0AAV2DG03_9ROSI